MQTKEEKLAEIRAIVARVKLVQDSEGLSDTRLIEEYPDLGSTRTWHDRLLTGDLGDLNLEKQLDKLRRVAAILDGGLPGEQYLDKMQFAFQMNTRLEKLESQTNDRRILVCLAPNGTGKSLFARWAVAQKRGDRAVVRCRPTWRNKSLHLCLGIGRALGLELNTTNPAVAEDRIINALKTARTLFFDQAHEGGVAVMHLLRALVDETPSRFVYLAYNTAFARVQTSTADAMIEARAFLGRCMKPIFDTYEAGTLIADVRFYLSEIAGLDKVASENLAGEIIGTLNAHTNLRLLDDAIAAAAADTRAEHPDPKKIAKQVKRLAGVTETLETKEAA